MAATEAPDDALVNTGKHNIRLPIFEGPLDLLLFLIKKSELDIYDIPIESVTKQYLDILYGMENLSLEIAGEFFVMAATLMHIKSRMLLPKNEQIAEPESEDDDVDPRWELVQQLIEYKKFKETALKLEELSDKTLDLLPRIYKVHKEDRPERPIKNSDKIEIWNVFNQVLRRLAEKITVGRITDEAVSVADRMEFILEYLEDEDEFLFSKLFGENTTINTIIATFLAVLELTRLKKIDIEQHEDFEEIRCTKKEIENDPEEESDEAFEDNTFD